LPPANDDAFALREVIDRLYKRLKIDLALFDSDHRRIAAAGRPLPAPRADRTTGGWLYGPGGPAWAIHLSKRAPLRHHAAIGLVAFLGGIALTVAVCFYPLVF
jgi:hypothetical protein